MQDEDGQSLKGPWGAEWSQTELRGGAALLRLGEGEAVLCEADAGLEAMLGWDPRGLCGQSLGELCGEELEPTVIQLVRALQEEGRPSTVEGRLLRGNGTWVPVLLSLAPLSGLSLEGRHGLLIVQDLSARALAAERMHWQLHRDTVTGLPTRLLMMDRLERLMAHSRRSQSMVGVMVVDVDGFRRVNEVLGWEAGDGVLRAVGARLQETLREEDSVGYLGGDQFAVIVNGLRQPQGAAKVGQKLLEAFSRPLEVGEDALGLSVSVGICVYPMDGATPARLLELAEQAMRQAHWAGGNRFQFYSPELQISTSQRLVMDLGLKQAISRNELEVYYQPQVDAPTGTIIGAEALLRWKHGRLGPISPKDFIPLAEENGAIVPIGEWVLRTACLQNRRWQAAGLGPFPVAVNLSPRQLRQADFPRVLREVLAWSGLEPRYLELELTESSLVEDNEAALAMMLECKALGVSISIDDFGTGFSTLSRLHRLPVDVLKLDQSFLEDVGRGRGPQVIRGIVNLAHELELRVIAEGVETRAQLELLNRLHCHEIQGFYFSPPLPASKLEPLLSRPFPFGLPSDYLD